MARGAQGALAINARHGEREQHRHHLAQRDHRHRRRIPGRIGPGRMRSPGSRRRTSRTVDGSWIDVHQARRSAGTAARGPGAIAAASARSPRRQQDAGREDEQQDQRQVLGDPRGDARRAVEHRRVRLRERHRHHQQAGPARAAPRSAAGPGCAIGGGRPRPGSGRPRRGRSRRARRGKAWRRRAPRRTRRSPRRPPRRRSPRPRADDSRGSAALSRIEPTEPILTPWHEPRRNRRTRVPPRAVRGGTRQTRSAGQALTASPWSASWRSFSACLESEDFSTVPPYSLSASTALSGVTFSTTTNRADVPGWSMSRT